MDKDTLEKATATIKQNPKSFLHTYDVLEALQAIENDMAARTDDTDTLAVSVPTNALEDLSKLEWLPYVEDHGVGFDYDKLTFDWFSMPEDKTGFGVAAAEFIETLVKALDAISDPNPYNDDTIAAMEEAVSRDPNAPSYPSVEELMESLRTEENDEE